MVVKEVDTEGDDLSGEATDVEEKIHDGIKTIFVVGMKVNSNLVSQVAEAILEGRAMQALDRNTCCPVRTMPYTMH